MTVGADVTLEGGWRCLECGRIRHRDDVFIHDAGPVCRVKEGPDGCYAAQLEDDQNEYEPYRDDRGATA